MWKDRGYWGYWGVVFLSIVSWWLGHTFRAILVFSLAAIQIHEHIQERVDLVDCAAHLKLLDNKLSDVSITCHDVITLTQLMREKSPLTGSEGRTNLWLGCRGHIKWIRWVTTFFIYGTPDKTWWFHFWLRGRPVYTFQIGWTEIGAW